MAVNLMQRTSTCEQMLFTLGATAVLALGVGVNVAELQICDAMVWSRLHFRDARSVLQLSHVSDDGRRLGFASGAIEFFQVESRSFAWLGTPWTS